MGDKKDKIYNLPKIIFSRSATFVPKINDNISVTYNGEAILFNSMEEAKNALTIINSKLSHFLNLELKWSGFMSSIMYNNIILMEDLSHPWTDDKIYDYFDLSKKEREYIEEKSKGWFESSQKLSNK